MCSSAEAQASATIPRNSSTPTEPWGYSSTRAPLQRARQAACGGRGAGRGGVCWVSWVFVWMRGVRGLQGSCACAGWLAASWCLPSLYFPHLPLAGWLACLRQGDAFLPHFGQGVAAVQHLLVEPAGSDRWRQGGRAAPGWQAAGGASIVPKLAINAPKLGTHTCPSWHVSARATTSNPSQLHLLSAQALPTVSNPPVRPPRPCGALTSARAPSRCAAGRCSGC